MNIVILLTTTVNVERYISSLKQKNKEDRKNMYMNIINLWLTKTKFKIVVVENSGYNFDIKNENLEQITFISPKKKIKKKLPQKKQITSKGQHEMYSLCYACKNSKFIKDSDYVIKITGRYFITKLEIVLNNRINKNTKIIHQSTKFKSSKIKGVNRCEIVGCSTKLIKEFFKFPLSHNTMEIEMMNRYKIYKKYKKLKLPEMKLHKKTIQGCGKVLKSL